MNPVRAEIVEKPEEYRWSSIGYHAQRSNEGGFLSLGFGLAEFGPSEIRSAVTGELHGVNDKSVWERLSHYRKFLYEKGDISGIDRERVRDFELSRFDKFRYRTRYFIDSGIIGSHEFVDPPAIAGKWVCRASVLAACGRS